MSLDNDEMVSLLLMSHVFVIVVTLISIGLQFYHMFNCWCW